MAKLNLSLVVDPCCQIRGKCQEMKQRTMFLLFSLSQVLWWYVNGVQLVKFGLLIDRTSPIYHKAR
jgi:hypothetical protein